MHSYRLFYAFGGQAGLLRIDNQQKLFIICQLEDEINLYNFVARIIDGGLCELKNSTRQSSTLRLLAPPLQCWI